MRASRILWTLILVIAIVLAIWRPLLSRRHARLHRSIPDRSLTSPLNQPGGGASPDDAYAVYSALYQAPVGEPLVFVQESFTDIPQVNGNCLQPATQEERDMAAAFEAANAQSHTWQARFDIRAYGLLTRSEATHGLGCLAAHAQGAAGCQDLKNVKHIRYLGVPGFNREHTRALVSVIKLCGVNCGSGGIFVVEKSGGTWQRAPDSNFNQQCSWRY